jgi:hypothetical protein
MWFDVSAAIARLADPDPTPTLFLKDGKAPPQSSGNSGNSRPLTPARAFPKAESKPGKVAGVAEVAPNPPRKQAINSSLSNPETYLAYLHRDGPSTYGAGASALVWGATRAWLAEARLRAAGKVRIGQMGRAFPAPLAPADSQTPGYFDATAEYQHLNPAVAPQIGKPASHAST